MKRAAPARIRLDEDEVWRVQRVRIAERLHKLPSEVDNIPYADVCDLLEVWRADESE